MTEPTEEIDKKYQKINNRVNVVEEKSLALLDAVKGGESMCWFWIFVVWGDEITSSLINDP